jgi:hypothetical protein
MGKKQKSVRKTKYRLGGLCRVPLMLCGLLCLFVACDPEMPSDVIPPSRMEAILYDYHVAQAMAEESYDSVEERRYLYVQAVFRKHNVDEADFDSSMVWYSAHADHLTKIYRSLAERYEAEAKAYGGGNVENELYANLDNGGDTANIWTGRTFYVLRPNRVEGKMEFTLKDSTFRRGDSFLWRFKPRFICKEGAHVGYSAIIIRYTNGKVKSMSRRVDGDYEVKMELAADEKRDIRELYGFIYFPSMEEVKTYRMMAVSDVALIRFHRPEPLEKDTLVADTLKADTLLRDTVAASLQDTANARRLSPSELRRTQEEGERTINVVKERPYVVPKNTRRRQRTRTTN